MRQYLEELKAEERAEARAEADARRIKMTIDTLKEYIDQGKLHLDVSEEEFYSFVRDGGEPETV